MSQKKTKFYVTQGQPIRPGGASQYLLDRDPNDALVYTWYNVSSAVIDGTGKIIMRASGQCRTGSDAMQHWNGQATIPPDHPDYARFVKAVEEAKKPD